MIILWVNEQFNIEFWFSDNLKEHEAKVREDDPDYEVVLSRGLTTTWWDDKRKIKKIGIYASSTATLAHECVHAANRICCQIDQQPDPDNDEFFCYLVEDIFRQYCKRIKPNWNKEAWRQ